MTGITSVAIANIAIADDGTYWDTDTKSFSVIVPEEEHKSPFILVPDGRGDYQQHVFSKPKRRLGF